MLYHKIKTQAKAWIHILVHHIDLSWNTIEPSLMQMYEKLIQLGFVYYNGEIRVVEPETEEGQRHHV